MNGHRRDSIKLVESSKPEMEVPRTPVRFSYSAISIKNRLRFFIGTLVLVIIVISIWSSYLSVKEAALEVGRQRLLNLTQQLASMSQQSTALLLTKTATAANDEVIRSFIQSPNPTSQPAALAILRQFETQQDPNGSQAEIWTVDHNLVLTAPVGKPAQPGDLDIEFRQASTDPFKVVGPIRIVNEIPVFPVVVAIKNDTSKVIGFLVRWRRVAATPEARKQLTELLGSQAELYFGNSRGDIWTDLVAIADPPPGGLQSTLEVTHYSRAGNPVMALGRPIAGTPFFVVVEFPVRAFAGPARRFLSRMILIGLGLFGIGIVGAIALSRSITRPLHTLTKAAAAISHGDYSSKVDINQKNELGELADAFNAMTVKIGDSQRELERKVYERKLAEEAAAKLAAIVESSDDAIIGKTLDGVITSWNKGAEKLYGIKSEEAIGRSIEMLFPPERSAELRDILQRLARAEVIEQLETERLTKDGHQLAVSLTISPIKDENGRVRGASTIARDITERKRAAKELSTSKQNLEQALATLQAKSEELAAMTQQLWQSSKLATMGELAASVAHELNNPLAIVALRAESVFEQLPPDDTKRKAMHVIVLEVERMANLVNNLLQFSRRSHPQMSSVDVREEITNSLDFIHYYLRNRNAKVSTDFASTLSSVQADRQQLRQLFLNLLTNASDAMPSGGVLTVTVTRDRMEDGRAAVKIEFKDSGIGISGENLARIWEPFFTTKPEGKGTGLGLAMCRRIVEEHKGTINLESQVGLGTTVRISLPATNNGGS